MKKYKIDLHIHSTLSHDGGIDFKDIQNIFNNKILDQIAITDHNEIDFALDMAQRFPNKIIVGEEIKTIQGEIIGLFLKKKIKKGMTLAETINAIRDQQGLCFLPHPYSTRRNGVGGLLLEVFYDLVDFIEGYNGRAIIGLSNRNALAFSKEHSLIYAANSDAHSIKGVGKVYNMVEENCIKDNLLEQLRTAEHMTGRPGLMEYLAPGLNKLKKRLR
jgi:hypothetical protein